MTASELTDGRARGLALALLAAASAAVALTALPRADLSPAEALTAGAAIVVFLAPLFAPLRCRPAALIAWAGGAGALGVLIGALLAAPRAVSFAHIVAVALLSAALLFVVLGLAGRAARCVGEEFARLASVGLLAVASAAPLWLGPLALESGSDGRVASGLLALSPLVHLAVAAGADLLRSPWFYAHTSLGSLRFDYPAASILALCYGAAALGVAALSRFRQELSV